MQNFAHGQSYVTNSRTRLFKNLGFLHAKVKPGEKPCFVNVVCQRALGANVLHVQQREADEKKRVRRADDASSAGGGQAIATATPAQTEAVPSITCASFACLPKRLRQRFLKMIHTFTKELFSREKVWTRMNPKP